MEFYVIEVETETPGDSSDHRAFVAFNVRTARTKFNDEVKKCREFGEEMQYYQDSDTNWSPPTVHLSKCSTSETRRQLLCRSVEGRNDSGLYEKSEWVDDWTFPEGDK